MSLTLGRGRIRIPVGALLDSLAFSGDSAINQRASIVHFGRCGRSGAACSPAAWWWCPTSSPGNLGSRDHRDHRALTVSRSAGPALPGWHLLVADEEGRVQPPGMPGEICVGGAGVAEGYRNQENLTAQRFRLNPHTGTRLHHSGDLGRLRPDGRLEHLGRRPAAGLHAAELDHPAGQPPADHERQTRPQRPPVA
ncbi:AMP-binding protein [Crossiella sp. NPDC003009]